MKVYFLEGRNVSYDGVTADAYGLGYDSHNYTHKSKSGIVKVKIVRNPRKGSFVSWKRSGKFAREPGDAAVPHSHVAKMLRAVRVAVVHHIKKEGPGAISYISENPRKLSIYRKGIAATLAKHGYTKFHADPLTHDDIRHTWSRP